MVWSVKIFVVCYMYISLLSQLIKSNDGFNIRIFFSSKYIVFFLFCIQDEIYIQKKTYVSVFVRKKRKRKLLGGGERGWGTCVSNTKLRQEQQ